jgi:cytochrome c556
MRFTIDPIADNIFDAVTWDISKKGVVETKPRNDEDWEKVKIGAVTLAEAIYLLKVPRLFAPPGDVNNSTGPNPPELSPAQIKAKVDKDPVLWDAKIEALRNVAKEVMEIADKKDVDSLFAASEDLDMACEACHLEYWYPGDRAAVDDDARQRARIEKSAIRSKKK